MAKVVFLWNLREARLAWPRNCERPDRTKARLRAMEEDSEARKNRLKALREKANKKADAPVKFRNYRPSDSSLLGSSTETSENQAQAGEAKAPPAAPKPVKKAEEEDAIKRELKKHLEEHGGGQDVLNIAPRKPNWDLKRDVAKKMEKLDRMTQKAIVELLREKIANQEDEDDDEEEEDEEEG